MKTVFNSSEIPHLWAHGSGPHGRSPSALSFQGSILRSYATDIGRILEQGRAVLLNCSHYSVTTSAHQSAMRCAVSHYPLQFEVRGLDRGEVLRRLLPAQIVDSIVKQAVECYQKAQRARTYRDMLENDARRYAQMANDAAVYFKLRRQPVAFDKLPSIAKQLTVRERAARTKARRAAEKAETELRERIARSLAEWQNGEEAYTGNFWRLPVALRLVNDAEQGQPPRWVVETSHGARVLLSQALRLFRYCSALRERGETYSALGSQNHPVHSRPFAVGPYTLESITREGDAVIGCHSLSFVEMKRLFDSLTDEQKNAAEQPAPAEVGHV